MNYPNQPYVGYKTFQSGLKHVLLAGFLVAPGTGGDVSAQNIERLKAPLERHVNPFVPIQVNTVQSIAPQVVIAGTNEDLNHIIEILNPNISELAKALHVSRQAIYKWKKGEPAGRDSAEKLQDLAQAANVFAQAGLSVTPQMLRRTVSNGQNFWEIVESGGSATAAAQTLTEIVMIGQRQRALLNERLASKAKLESMDSDFPVSYEDDYPSV
jgi:transcriptional regulator with XRE-family HTH domain